jgi:hypothetical protein
MLAIYLGAQAALAGDIRFDAESQPTPILSRSLVETVFALALGRATKSLLDLQQ